MALYVLAFCLVSYEKVVQYNKCHSHKNKKLYVCSVTISVFRYLYFILRATFPIPVQSPKDYIIAMYPIYKKKKCDVNVKTFIHETVCIRLQAFNYYFFFAVTKSFHINFKMCTFTSYWQKHLVPECNPVLQMSPIKTLLFGSRLGFHTCLSLGLGGASQPQKTAAR